MTISFFEPGDVPQPPDKVKIELLEAEPHSEGWRVKINIHVTPFQQRPNLEINLLKQMVDGSANSVANFSIIETMHPRMEFTMHIRGVDDPYGDYQLQTMLFYRDQPDPDAAESPPPQIKDTRELNFSITEEGNA